ncbi:MAG: hypothetical protein Kow0079_08450 [Vicingaceae bacterium]
MKKLLLNLYFGSISIISFSQNSNPCYFDEYTNNKTLLSREQAIQTKIKQNNFHNKTHDSIRIIPVVVHVIHEGGSENISDAQIIDGITVLNEDYGKLPGTNGDGNGVDMKVRFCLAKIDPNGNCTNGIVRIKSSLTNHQTYERPLLKELSFWDNNKYLNIYIVKSISGGVLGYSSFPGGPPNEDGVVVKHNYFGRIGTAISTNSLGRTTTHELGHWFGIYHTFNNGCGSDLCNDGDYVCDTPPVASPNFGCPSSVNSCNNDVPDVPDQIENYLDYTSDACKNMFTNGQKQRLQATLDTLRTVIWSAANLVATGCDSAYTPPPYCMPVADFTTLTPTVCVGNQVYFMDKSLNNVISWDWYFQGGSIGYSNQQNPTVQYDTLGVFDVTLIVTDSLGNKDTAFFNNYINVTNPGIGISLPFSEDFENGFPNQGITINNPDGGITWELDSSAFVSGNYSVKINNLINTNYGSVDEIILPEMDLTSIANPYLTFKWAYAKSDPNYSDELIVQLSNDCGANYNQIFYRTQSSLVTGPTQTTPFIPDSTQWKSASINLQNYASDTYVSIKIVNVTDGGNNLYIDDININTVNSINDLSKASDIKLFPNPTNGFVSIIGVEPIQLLELYSIDGKKLFVSKQDLKEKIDLNLNFLSNGYYLIIIKTQSKTIINKLLKF